MIRIKSTCEVAKTFAVKRETQDDKTEIVVAHLKIAECMIDRDQLDELCGQPIGWSNSALYDEFGAPRAHVTLTLHRCERSASGVIRGGDKSTDSRLTLKDAELSSVTLELAPLGALLACQLSWVAAGDEVDDMLGKLCGVNLVVTDGGQKDMLRDSVQSAAASIRNLAAQDGIESVELQVGGKTIARFGKDSPPDRHNRISSADEVMKLLQKNGFHLRGSDPDYWVERPDGSDRQGVWLNAARSVLKRGLEPIGDDQAGDEVGRWRWKEVA